MKKHLLFLIIYSVVFTQSSKAQLMVEYYDSNKQPCHLDEAATYRKISYDKTRRPIGKVRDYDISGTLLFEGKMTATNPDVLHDTCIWYYNKGAKKIEAVYSNGVIKKVRRWSILGKEEGVLDESSYFFSLEYLEQEIINIEATLNQPFAKDSVIVRFLLQGAVGVSSQGKYNLAFQYLKIAHDIAKRFKRIKDLGRCYLNIGGIFQYEKQYGQAIVWNHKAIEIFRTLKMEEDLAIAYHNIAFTYQSIFDSEKAIKNYAHAIDLEKKLSLKKALTSSYYYTGILYKKESLFKKAIYFLNECKVLIENGVGIDSSFLVDTYIHIGDCYNHLGQYQQALIYAEKVEEIAKKAKLDDLLSEGYLLKGSTYNELKEYDLAKKYLHKAEISKIQIQDTEQLAVTYNQLGMTYQALGEYEKSMQYLIIALGMRKNSNSKIEAAIAINNTGLTFSLWDNNEYAKWCFKEAIKVWEEENDEFYLAKGYNNLGGTYLFLDSLEQGKYFIKKAIKLNKKIGNDWGLFSDYANLANMYWKLQKPDSALHYAQLNLMKNHQFRASNLASKDRLLFVKNNLSGLEVGVLSACELQKKNIGFSFVENSKARQLVDLLTEKEIVNTSLPEGLSNNFQKIENQLKKVNLELASNIPIIRRNRLLDNRDSLYNRYTLLKDRIRLLDPAFANLIYPKPVDIQELQSVLYNNEVFINFFVGDLQTIAVIITSSQTEIINLGISNRIKKLINRFKIDFVDKQKEALKTGSLLSENTVRNNFHTISSQLYKTLWLPLAQTKLLNDKHMILSPDDALHYLPFELLINNQVQEAYANYNYLLLDHSITYSSSATLLHYERTRGQSLQKTFKDFLGLGIVNFEDNHCSESNKDFFNNLLRSKWEIMKLASLFDEIKNDILLDNKASEESFKRLALNEYKYIHFSTHGLINPEKPSFNKLLLTPSNNEDGCLNMYELFDLNLNADLVSFSACETGLGQLIRGEGMIGFSRALTYAGAPTAIVSLWEVQDFSTSYLFVDFYTELRKNPSNKYLPLRKAQRKMINAGGKYSNPYYWAPFIFQGAITSRF